MRHLDLAFWLLFAISAGIVCAEDMSDFEHAVRESDLAAAEFVAEFDTVPEALKDAKQKGNATDADIFLGQSVRNLARVVAGLNRLSPVTDRAVLQNERRIVELEKEVVRQRQHLVDLGDVILKTVKELERLDKAVRSRP